MAFNVNIQESDRAPTGYVWVCQVCGRLAENREQGGITEGWGASCFFNALLCEKSSIKLAGDRVRSAQPLLPLGEIK